MMKKIKENIEQIVTLKEFEVHLKNKTNGEIKTLIIFLEEYLFNRKNGISSLGQGTMDNAHREEIVKKLDTNIEILIIFILPVTNRYQNFS